MTAQHAVRQGKLAGRNVTASLHGRPLGTYMHHDLGFVVDLGGLDAAANPLGIPLSGLPAGVVTRGYHLAAMPGNRLRTLVDWTADAVLGRQKCNWAWRDPVTSARVHHPGCEGSKRQFSRYSSGPSRN
jgi:NADH dehydrogenase